MCIRDRRAHRAKGLGQRSDLFTHREPAGLDEIGLHDIDGFPLQHFPEADQIPILFAACEDVYKRQQTDLHMDFFR